MQFYEMFQRTGESVHFFVAECLSFPQYGKHWDSLIDVKDACTLYESLPSGNQKVLGVRIVTNKKEERLNLFVEGKILWDRIEDYTLILKSKLARIYISDIVNAFPDATHVGDIPSSIIKEVDFKPYEVKYTREIMPYLSNSVINALIMKSSISDDFKAALSMADKTQLQLIYNILRKYPVGNVSRLYSISRQLQRVA